VVPTPCPARSASPCRCCTARVRSFRALRDAQPLLRVEMTVSDSRQDLIAEGADVAIRLGKRDDSVFGARRLAMLDRLLIASPSYLRTRDVPKRPADLAFHDCIFGPGGFDRDSWTFKNEDTVISVDVQAASAPILGPGFSPVRSLGWASRWHRA
jgi:DNA-binding transcriptional LysR family regulator